MHCITFAFLTMIHAFQLCAYYVKLMCVVKFGLGSAHDVFKFAYHMLMHFHAYIPSFIFNLIFILLVLFCVFLSLPPSFVSCSMAPKQKSTPSQYHLRSWASLLLTLLLAYGSMMIKPERNFRRTFLNEAFIRNTKSFYRTFPILTFPLSSIVRVEGHCVTSRSLVRP